MVSVEEVTPYLLGRGLIHHDWVIDGVLSIEGATRRNRNFRVEGPGGVGYLIKQPDGPDADGHRTLRTEAAFYKSCQDGPAVEVMTRVAPRLAYFDPERSLLALQLVADARPLWAVIEERGIEILSRGSARSYGFALGLVHRVFGEAGLGHAACPAELGADLPWIMTIHRPGPEVLVNLDGAALQAIRILQGQDGLGAMMDTLVEKWRIQTVIHGDLRLDNVLAWPFDGDPGWQVRIVDWEMVRLGDPAWDLGGALQDFVGSWVGSMPFGADLTIDERVAGAAYALEDVQRGNRSLLEGYRSATGLSAACTDRLLDRAVEFSAARMVQTAIELSYDASQLTPQSVILLQIAANILSGPERARVQLYGLPLLSPHQ